jgi:hypothetical protein
MPVMFVYCDLKIYWRLAIIFSRSFDNVDKHSRGHVAMLAAKNLSQTNIVVEAAEIS